MSGLIAVELNDSIPAGGSLEILSNPPAAACISLVRIVMQNNPSGNYRFLWGTALGVFTDPVALLTVGTTFAQTLDFADPAGDGGVVGPPGEGLYMTASNLGDTITGYVLYKLLGL